MEIFLIQARDVAVLHIIESKCTTLRYFQINGEYSVVITLLNFASFRQQCKPDNKPCKLMDKHLTVFSRRPSVKARSINHCIHCSSKSCKTITSMKSNSEDCTLYKLSTFQNIHTFLTSSLVSSQIRKYIFPNAKASLLQQLMSNRFTRVWNSCEMNSFVNRRYRNTFVKFHRLTFTIIS